MARKSIYLPTHKEDWTEVFAVAILLIVVRWCTSELDKYTAKYFQNFADVVNAFIVGIVLGTILEIAGHRKYAVLTFALAVGNMIANYVVGKIPA